jgi:hypothetical protein
MQRLNDWYFLREDRSSFKPQPLRDGELMLCHRDVEASIRFAIEKAFALGETVKLLLWGDWGVGKTHTLRHIEHWLRQHSNEYPARTIFIEIGDVRRDSSFGVIHKDLVDGIGLAALVDLAFAYMRAGGNLLGDLERLGIPASIREAFNKLYVAIPGQAPPEIVQTAWHYLRGDDVGAKGSALGLPRQLEDGKEFYYVLAALGHIVRKVENRQLLFLVDEAAKLEAVSAVAEKERHWVNVNKLIFDQENSHFGFVYTVSGKGVDELPVALFEPQIENRLGKRKIELKNLEASDVRSFLRDLIAAFVDKQRVEGDQQAAVATHPAYDPAAYPFTAPALDRFVDYFERSQENSKPRDITDRLDDAAFYAMKDGERLIGEGVLSSLEM